MEAYLSANVQESLSLYLYDNARFLCERLMALAPTEQNVFLLATCYKHCNMVYRAYRLLRGCQSGPSRYLFSICCMDLGKYSEAEEALTKFGDAQVPNGAAGFYLLGRVCKLCGGRTKDAARHFTRALRLNPMLWSAFEELCSLGEDQAASEFSQPPTPHNDLPSNPFNFSFPLPQNTDAMDTTISSAFTPSSRSLPSPSFPPSTPSPSKTANSSPLDMNIQSFASPAWPPAPTPTPSPSAYLTPTPTAALAPPPVTKKNEVAVPFPGFSAGSSHPPPPTNRTPILGQRHKVVEDGKLRKVSGKLFNEQSPVRRSARLAASHSGVSKPPHPQQPSPSSMSTDTSSTGPFTFLALPGSASSPSTQGGASKGSGGRGEGHEEDDSEAVAAALMAEGQAATHQLLVPLFEGYRHLSMFRCHEALEALKQANQQQYNTGWVLCQVARAHHEMSDYTNAVATFEAARKVDPWRVENMEIFSTALWHLKRETDLAFLAHEMKDIDRLAPQTWCVLGNCLSLQKEHEAAVQLFQRALQLQPSFAYAYTLAGHEYYQNEDFDKAVGCYRNAFRLDPRHYNALFGIGNIHFKREQYDVARKNFALALEIFPGNSVLKCYIGMACHKMGKYEEAMEMVQEAIELEPNNKVARFEKASILTSMERVQEALQELHVLQDMAPKEVNVHFQLGKLYKRVGEVDAALQHFNTALDLQPNSADVSSIKSAIEKIDISDDNEQEEL